MNRYTSAAIWALVMLPFLLNFLYYGLTKPRLWVREPIGRALMILHGSMVAVMSLAILRRLSGASGIYEFLFWPAIFGVTVAGWYLFRNLRHLQRAAARARHDRESRERASAS